MEPAEQLVRQLVDLRRSRASCLVDVRNGDRVTTLAVVGGELVAAESSMPPVPLGRVLARRRAITRDHQVEILERMSRAAGVQTRFGELCVGLGYASPDDVANALIAQVRSLVVRVLLGAPTWTLRDLSPGRSTARDVAMPIESLTLETARWLERVRDAGLGLAAIRVPALAPTWSLPEVVERFELTQEEVDFAATALRGERLTTELLEPEPRGIEARAILTALAMTGAVINAPQGAPPGVPPPVQARRRELPAWAMIDVEAAKRAAAAIVLAGGGATGAGVTDAARSERAFLRARECLRRGDIKRSLEAVEEALTIDPRHVEADLVGRWCRQSLRREGLAADVALEFERVAREALVESADLAFGHFLLGEALQARGETESARTHLLQALRIEKELFDGIRERRLATTSSKVASAIPSFPKSSPRLEGARANLERSVGAPIQQNTTLIMGETPLAAPPPPLLPFESPPSEPAGSRTLAFVLGGLGVIVAGVVLGLGTAGVDLSSLRGHGPDAPRASASTPRVAPPATSMPAPPPTIDAAVPTAPLVTATTPEPAASADASAEPPGSRLDARSGRVHLPANALGHRVFIDGRLAGSDVSELVLPCGTHELRIGSKGAPRSVEVPCGSEIDLR